MTLYLTRKCKIPLASVADRITFFPDVIGNELVNVGEERSLDWWDTDTIYMGSSSGKNLLLTLLASSLFAIWIS